MNIITYPNQDIRNYLGRVKGSIEKSKRVSLPYLKWAEKYLPIMYERTRGTHEEIKAGAVRYTSTQTLFSQYKKIEQQVLSLSEQRAADPNNASVYDAKIFELMKEAFVPEYEFDYKGEEEFRGLPIWYMNTLKGINMIIGPRDLDLSDPVGIQFNNDVVHNTLQGTTGCGKSVAMRTIMFNLMMLIPPWEVDINYIDMKGSEGPLFARKVQESHCKVIAATNSKDFLLNLYESFREENELRQSIFSQAGCSNITDFRKKFNLVLPQIIYILDEFLQGILEIENSENIGNAKAGDELSFMFMVLTKIATLGRNAGLHMIISSQDLGAKLKPAVAGQVQSGISLACTAEISKHTLGNSLASEQIDRKGIAIINSSRLMTGNETKNVTVGVPFMDDSPRQGQQYSLPEEILLELDEVRKKYSFYKGFYFYDATVKISSTKYEEASKISMEEVMESPTATSLMIPLGETISYTNQHTVYLRTAYRANDAIAVASIDDNILKYMFDILYKGYCNIKGSNARVRVLYADDSSLRLIEDTQLQKNGEKIKTKLLSPSNFAMVSNRMMVLQIQELLNQNKLEYSFMNAFKVYSEIKSPRRNLFQEYKNELSESESVCSDSNMDRWITAPIISDCKPEDKQLLVDVLKAVFLLFSQKAKLGLENSQSLEAFMLDPLLVYWLNPEDIDNIFDDKILEGMRTYLTDSGKVNVTNVVYSDRWTKLRSCIPTINHVLEFSNKEFASDISAPMFIANVNKDSLIVHDKRKSKSTLLKIYGGI